MVALAVDNLLAALGFGADAGRPPNALNLDAIAGAGNGDGRIAGKKR
jgi:gluconate 2-dehydrogenase